MCDLTQIPTVTLNAMSTTIFYCTDYRFPSTVIYKRYPLPPSQCIKFDVPPSFFSASRVFVGPTRRALPPLYLFAASALGCCWKITPFMIKITNFGLLFLFPWISQNVSQNWSSNTLYNRRILEEESDQENKTTESVSVLKVLKLLPVLPDISAEWPTKATVWPPLTPAGRAATPGRNNSRPRPF